MLIRYLPPMNLLAEVSDKIVSTGQVWMVMAVLSAIGEWTYARAEQPEGP